ncbi:hypothetical protein PVAND_017594 [Polypedilum vanderplanki]|uniref:Uncharacterized protein n=1 Tax=Polypedilum vanderplanki TaxID=319348 RepID=A0A9J6B928_POLVA|nr:hypothetical protein PVAND_017594 [Polypedilum vanderplanki]
MSKKAGEIIGHALATLYEDIETKDKTKGGNKKHRGFRSKAGQRKANRRYEGYGAKSGKDHRNDNHQPAPMPAPLPATLPAPMPAPLPATLPAFMPENAEKKKLEEEIIALEAKKKKLLEEIENFQEALTQESLS